MEWNSDDPTPPMTGWYATLHWEGFFPSAAFWNGEKWNKDLPVVAWAGPFDAMEDAEKWANDNDPDL